MTRQPPATRFERDLSELGGLLLRVMIVLVAVIFVANVLLARPPVDAFLFSVALAVGLTPQLLPAIVSVSLSLGARQMARAKVIVKRLSAIEDFGGMDVLCTDKTGTLTTGTVQLAGAMNIDGQPSTSVLEAATINARLHAGFANPIDDAILRAGGADHSARLLAELPYDFQRRRMSVLVSDWPPLEHVLLTKGAVDDVLEVSRSAERADGTLVPLEQARQAIRQRFEQLSGDGYRVLGVARRSLGVATSVTPADEDDMVFVGFLAFLDPPKAGVGRTLRELAALGISLRIVTGDNRLAAAHVARVVGIDTTLALTGDDVAQLDDAALASRVESVAVFAEVDPVQKERLVRASRQCGHEVGFLGDDINDAPALHAADVRISVDTAVDVARDAASIVLLEKDLNVLMQGVRLGRRMFANTLKYLFVTISANFGNMASMAAATVVMPFLPLLPLQILIINFLTDLPGTTIATDAVDPEQLQQPGAWDLRFLRNFMVVFGLVSSLFDGLTFVVLRLGFNAGEALFRSGWFLESVATELAVMLVLRTRRPFFRSRPSATLLGSSVVVGLVAVFIIFGPLAAPLGFTRLPTGVLVALLGITAAYVVVTEVAKRLFYRQHTTHRGLTPAAASPGAATAQ